jgi:hypothetical protein
MLVLAALVDLVVAVLNTDLAGCHRRRTGQGRDPDRLGTRRPLLEDDVAAASPRLDPTEIETLMRAWR